MHWRARCSGLRRGITSSVAWALVFFALSSTGVAVAGAPEGTIVAWGENNLGQAEVPPPNNGFVAVAAGLYYSLGLKADGSIVEWGVNPTGETTPRVGFIAVAEGASTVCFFGCFDLEYGLGLKADGSIVGWGNNTVGQLDVPPPNAQFVAIDAGQGHSLGLKANGSIVGWGDNKWGQLDVPPPNANFIAIAAGYHHSLGLKADGSVVAWGDNSEGELDVPAPNTGFIAIAANGYQAGIDSAYWEYYSLGLKADGSIVAWGCCRERSGGCDNSCCFDTGACTVPEPNTGFVAIAAGPSHALGLKADGSIVAWGSSTDIPAQNTGFVAIAAGDAYSLAIRSTDCDSDSVVDGVDACTCSEGGETVSIGECETHVHNLLFEDGCTMMDLIAQCRENETSQGQYVGCVAHLAAVWRRDGQIRASDSGRIMSCAVRKP